LHHFLPTGRQAFTLVELLVVIAIVGMLSSVAIVATSGSRDKAKLAAAQSFEASVQHAAGSETIGEWLFKEGSGGTVGDSSGNGYNGTVTGMTWGAGVNDSSGVFTGSGTYVSLGSSSSLNPVNFTVTAWIKPGNFSGSYNYIYSNARDCCGTYNGINFLLYNNILAGSVWNTGAATVSSVAKISNEAIWTFVAFSYNGSKLKLYINGKLDNALDSSLGVGQPASFGTYLGALSNCPGSCGFIGSIDQVRLYGAAIVASEIEKKYLAERESFLARK
jgi:prepilin-type N-terminal cleavage/methylation domain-containing protein